MIPQLEQTPQENPYKNATQETAQRVALQLIGTASVKDTVKLEFNEPIDDNEREKTEFLELLSHPALLDNFRVIGEYSEHSDKIAGFIITEHNGDIEIGSPITPDADSVADYVQVMEWELSKPSDSDIPTAGKRKAIIHVHTPKNQHCERQDIKDCAALSIEDFELFFNPDKPNFGDVVLGILVHSAEYSSLFLCRKDPNKQLKKNWAFCGRGDGLSKEMSKTAAMLCGIRCAEIRLDKGEKTYHKQKQLAIEELYS